MEKQGEAELSEAWGYVLSVSPSILETHNCDLQHKFAWIEKPHKSMWFFELQISSENIR